MFGARKRAGMFKNSSGSFYLLSLAVFALFIQGCEDSTLTDSSAVEASFTADKTTIGKNEKVQFTSTSTGDIKGLRWVFTGGEPTASTDPNPVVEYLDAGEFKVSLTVEGPNSNYDVETKQNFIVVTGSPEVNCPSTVQDHSGRSYDVIQIGGQCWMAEDLRTRYLNDGTPIADHELQKTTGESSGWENTTEPAYARSPEFDGSYSMIYNGWAALSGKLCPTGWRVPTKEDIELLRDTLGGSKGDAGHALKGTRFWEDDSKATNSSGFTAYPTVSRRETGYFNTQSIFGGTWKSSTSYWATGWSINSSRDKGTGLMVLTDADDDIDTRSENILNRGYACRCIKEN